MFILSRSFQAFYRLLVYALVSVGLSAPSLGAAATPAAPTEVNAQRMVYELASVLAAGRTDLFLQLSQLGFAEQVAELNRPGISTIHTFSPQVAIEALYRRAEMIEVGNGDRFLAVLYKDAASRSGAVATDPAFLRLQALARAMPALGDAPIRFAPMSQLAPAAMAKPLPPSLEAAIGTLADFYSARGFAQARAALLRNLQKPGFNRAAFDSILMTTRSPEAALRQMLDAGTPPPRAEIALRNLLREGMSASAILSIDAEAIRAIEQLSKELPPEYQRYADQEADVPSRREQAAAAAGTGQPGSVRKAADADVSAFFKRRPDDPAAPDPAPWQPSPPDGGSGGGGSPAAPRQMPEHRKAYDRYIDSTFESPTPRPTPGATPRTPRSFSTARYSARAGRGVSAGAAVEVGQVGQVGKPIKALWVSQRDDNRFGRLYVSLQVSGAEQAFLAASRVMFTDSFRSALAARWGQWVGPAQFLEGDILVLISMDPEHQVSTESANAALTKLIAAAIQGLSPDERRQLQALEKKRAAAVSAARRVGQTDAAAAVADPNAIELIDLGLSNLPDELRQKAMKDADDLWAVRGIVVHPSLVGRELAWSAARVDFWFNKLEALVAEVRKQNPGVVEVSAIGSLPDDMSTWQFYERDSKISLAPGSAGVRELVVTSAAVPGSAADPSAMRRSHFAVSIFSKEKASGALAAEDDLYRRPDMARKVQPLLDWLATRHHDFMRLNDFSESLSLLRWLYRSGVTPIVVDMAGDAKAIATPDRVDIGKGPSVGAKR